MCNDNNVGRIPHPPKVIYCQGPRGLQGEPGPAFETYLMAHQSEAAIVGDGNSIPFNVINIANNISITSGGVITFPDAGIYQINWWVRVLNDNETATLVEIDLNQLTPVGGTIAVSTSGNPVPPTEFDVIVGNAILSTPANSTYNLINNSGVGITVAPNAGYAALITITRIS